MKTKGLIKGGICLFAAIVAGIMPESCKSKDMPEEGAPQIFNIVGVVTKSDGGTAPGA